MRLMTPNELQLLSRLDLIALLDEISGLLPTFAEASPARANALHNLALIRAILALRGFALKHFTLPAP